MSKDVYLMKVLTPLHVGAGTGVGYIDLPIYREAHTDFPGIPASAVKGPLRTIRIMEVVNSIDENIANKLFDSLDLEEEEKKKYQQDKNGEIRILKLVEDLVEGTVKIKNNSNSLSNEARDILKDVNEISKAFGRKDHEGSAVFYDAKILFFPVRSLKGIFALITCPYVLKRFAEDTGIEVLNLSNTAIKKDECLVFKRDGNENGDVLIIKQKNKNEDKEKVVLEEFSLTVKNGNSLNSCLDRLIDTKRVCLVHDDIFTYVVKNFTEIQTHIKVDVESGTVDSGALWTEEYVPPESIFYTMIENLEINNKKIQIGGNTTTGKGLVEVKKL